jgi:hypothetical protein
VNESNLYNHGTASPALNYHRVRWLYEGRDDRCLCCLPSLLPPLPAATSANISLSADHSTNNRDRDVDAMAEVEPQSIKSRIAALNLEKVHAPAPGSRPTYSYDAVNTAKKKPPPPPPAQRPPQLRNQTVNNPPLLDNAPASMHHIGNQPQIEKPAPRVSPALPPRPPPRNNSQQSPALPPRKSSDRSVTRRESSESISTIASGVSTLSLGSVKTNGSNGGTLYQVRAPAYDPSKLPPLPPKKQEEQKSATRAAMTSKRNVMPSQALPPPVKASPPGKSMWDVVLLCRESSLMPSLQHRCCPLTLT